MIDHHPNELIINFNSTSISDNEFRERFGNQELSISNEIENYKVKHGILRIQNQARPLIIGIDNRTGCDIEEIKRYWLRLLAASTHQTTPLIKIPQLKHNYQ